MLEVKVTPKARHNRVEQLAENTFRVWTTAPPEKGAANSEVVKLLAETLHVAPGYLVIRRGFSSRQKVIELMDVP